MKKGDFWLKGPFPTPPQVGGGWPGEYYVWVEQNREVKWKEERKIKNVKSKMKGRGKGMEKGKEKGKGRIGT